MTDSRFIDGVLVQSGERLFFPNNRRVSQTSTPCLSAPTIGARAAVIRARIESTIRRAPQVMIKVTGGGRGMAAVAAHMRYISRNGRLPMENEQGAEREGKEAMHDLVDQWRLGGSHIGERSERREAFNIMLSMPRGTDPLIVQRAAREFARAEFADHRYVMVLHDHQANPHVHLSVKAESRRGKRPTHARRTCSAGGRRSRRSCAGGASMPRRHDRPRGASCAPIPTCGARRRRRTDD